MDSLRPPRGPAAFDAGHAAWIAFGTTLAVFFATMNRTIGFIDRGELAAVAWTFGIPHATGYPTLMLIAGAVSHLIPLRPVLVLNGLAAILVAAGAGVATLLLDRVLRAAAAEHFRADLRAGLALAGAWLMAFTLTWWQQANGFEVYALHALMMPLVVWTFLRWIDAEVQEDARAAAFDPAAQDEEDVTPPVPARPAPRRFIDRRPAFTFALVLGLSFTNHLTTVLLAPGLVAYAIARLGFGRLFARLPDLARGLALGLLPYVWLPLRSAMSPRFDWGAPHTLRTFLHHVGGGDYRGWMFADLDAMVAQARFLAWRLPSDFAWIGIVLAAIGALRLARRAPALAAMCGLIVLAGAAFATGYRIMDVESYLLTPILGLAMLATLGLLRIAERFGARAALACGAALVIANLALHWRDCDESRNQVVERITRDQLGPLPQNAVLLSTLWDYGLAASYYYQEVEHYRADVLIASPELMRVSWYLDELRRRAPELYARAEPAAGRYRDALIAIERGGAYRSRDIQQHHADFLNAFVSGAMRDRPVFVTSNYAALRQEWKRVPWHLAFWLRADDAYVPETPWTYQYRPWHGRVDGYVAMACWLYGESRIDRGEYEARHGRFSAARDLLASAATFDPKLKLEDIGPLPLGTQELVMRSIVFFKEVEDALDGNVAAR